MGPELVQISVIFGLVKAYMGGGKVAEVEIELQAFVSPLVSQTSVLTFQPWGK